MKSFRNIMYLVLVVLIFVMTEFAFAKNNSFNDININYAKSAVTQLGTKKDLVKKSFSTYIDEIFLKIMEMNKNDNINVETEDIQNTVEISEASPVPEEKQQEEIEQNIEQKYAYLTFDDDCSQNTVSILDTLKEYNVKATFFMAGRADPEIVKRINNEGHTIAVHTMTHDYKTIYASTKAFWEDIEQERDYLESIIGYKPILLRFPGGSNNTVSNKYCRGIMNKLVNQAIEYGYNYYDWNVSSGDASGKKISSEEIVNNINQQIQNKDNVMILMHQSAPKVTTAEALPQIIEILQQQGYSIVKVEENSFSPKFLKPTN